MSTEYQYQLNVMIYTGLTKSWVEAVEISRYQKVCNMFWWKLLHDLVPVEPIVSSEQECSARIVIIESLRLDFAILLIILLLVLVKVSLNFCYL